MSGGSLDKSWFCVAFALGIMNERKQVTQWLQSMFMCYRFLWARLYVWKRMKRSYIRSYIFWAKEKRMKAANESVLTK